MFGCHSSRNLKQEPKDLQIPEVLQETIDLIKFSLPYEAVDVKPVYRGENAE